MTPREALRRLKSFIVIFLTPQLAGLFRATPVCGVRHATADHMFYPLSAKNLQMFVLCAPARARATRPLPLDSTQVYRGRPKTHRKCPDSEARPPQRGSGCNLWTSSRKRGGSGPQRHPEARIAPSWYIGCPLTAVRPRDASTPLQCARYRQITDRSGVQAVGSSLETGAATAPNGTSRPELQRHAPLAPA
jgi:hypothetical protein